MPDQQVTITIPEAYVTMVIEAFNQVCGATLNMDIKCPATEETSSIQLASEVIIAKKGENETNLQMGKRVIRTLIKGVALANKAKTEDARFDGEVSQITSPDYTVPDGITE